MKFQQFIQTSTGIPDDVNVEYNEKQFNRVIRFLTSIEPEQLTETQLNQMVDIIKDLNLKQGRYFTNLKGM